MQAIGLDSEATPQRQNFRAVAFDKSMDGRDAVGKSARKRNATAAKAAAAVQGAVAEDDEWPDAPQPNKTGESMFGDNAAANAVLHALATGRAHLCGPETRW